jgi:hypothetical protein
VAAFIFLRYVDQRTDAAQFEERYWTQTTGLTLLRSSCSREWGPPSFDVAVVPIFYTTLVVPPLGCPTDPTAAALLLCSYVGYGTDRDAVNGYIDRATVQLGLWMEAPSERAAVPLRLFLF